MTVCAHRSYVVSILTVGIATILNKLNINSAFVVTGCLEGEVGVALLITGSSYENMYRTKKICSALLYNFFHKVNRSSDITD